MLFLGEWTDIRALGSSIDLDEQRVLYRPVNKTDSTGGQLLSILQTPFSSPKCVLCKNTNRFVPHSIIFHFDQAFAGQGKLASCSGRRGCDRACHQELEWQIAGLCKGRPGYLGHAACKLETVFDKMDLAGAVWWRDWVLTWPRHCRHHRGVDQAKLAVGNNVRRQCRGIVSGGVKLLLGSEELAKKIIDRAVISRNDNEHGY
jgi:hypothetical protein